MMTTVRIPLARDKGFFTVDEADVPLVTQYQWQLLRSGGKRYAGAYIRNESGNPSRVMAHRLILNPGPEWEVDHRDGNGLNNIRSNLRKATRHQNGANRGMSRNNTSGYKGVSLVKASGKWYAAIQHNGKTFNLGLYVEKDDAARAYDAKARELFGDFARCNFPLEGEEGVRRTIEMRDITAAEKANHYVPVRSDTGIRNVFFHARKQRYEVRFNIAGVSCQCGYYETLDEARAVADGIRAELNRS